MKKRFFRKKNSIFKQIKKLFFYENAFAMKLSVQVRAIVRRSVCALFKYELKAFLLFSNWCKGLGVYIGPKFF
jgi:hypothetical protein